MTPHFQRCCENWAWRGHSHLCVTSNKLAVARVVSHRRCQEELPNLAKCGSVPKLNFFIWHHLGPMRPRSRGSCGPCYRGAHFLFVVDLELLIQVCAVMSRILCWGGVRPRASRMLGKDSANWAASPANCFQFNGHPAGAQLSPLHGSCWS